MGFDPCDRSLKIWESIGTPTPQSGSSLGSVKVHSFTLSYTPKSMRCDFWASLLARAFANPYLYREPKARVVTIPTIKIFNFSYFHMYFIPFDCVHGSFTTYKCCCSVVFYVHNHVP
jgi:hypothetical protein